MILYNHRHPVTNGCPQLTGGLAHRCPPQESTMKKGIEFVSFIMVYNGLDVDYGYKKTRSNQTNIV